jgi:hypothetical protein
MRHIPPGGMAAATRRAVRVLYCVEIRDEMTDA